jgi:hypothetical protein
MAIDGRSSLGVAPPTFPALFYPKSIPCAPLSTPLTHLHTPILALAPSPSNSDRRRRCYHADLLTLSIFPTNEHRPELRRAEPHLLCPFPSPETHWNPTATANRRRPPQPSTTGNLPVRLCPR